MNYRKFKADHLFTGVSLCGNSNVLVTKPDGEVVSIIDEADAGDNVEIFEGIITPGFINAHCHLELSHLKGWIGEKTGLVDFVHKIVNERHFPEEEIQEAIDTAEHEMMANGIVAVGDICNNKITLSQKLRRNLIYYNFIEASGWLPALSGERWKKSKDLYDEFSGENLTASIVPHAPYSVSEELWKHMARFFANKTISIHNQETVFEDELFLKGTGDLLRMYQMMNIDNSFFSSTKKTSLQSCFNKLSGAASVIFVHNTFTSQADLDFIKENKPANQLVSFCLCPNANLYIENTFPPVKMLVENHCSITLGTDSLAGNYALDILEEMKTIQHRFPSVSLEKMLRWATVNGAKALQMNDILGSFEKGKRPGVVLIEKIAGHVLQKESTSKRIL